MNLRASGVCVPERQRAVAKRLVAFQINGELVFYSHSTARAATQSPVQPRRCERGDALKQCAAWADKEAERDESSAAFTEAPCRIPKPFLRLSDREIGEAMEMVRRLRTTPLVRASSEAATGS